ncbi:uncharacterized protein [Glycine max]|uniref:uncharacterized protein n=1 Tax=Glycine max TaxID=3847 RepID=UPI001B35709D|nr:uncharacterized protein LOC121174934 [Glycine max]
MVIGRTFGIEVSGDVDEVPQRRRLTTFACRQQATAPNAADGEHLDQAAGGVHEQPQELVIDDVRADAQDFLGRPHDTSVLTDYVYHVTTTVWNGEECLELKLSSRGRKIEKFGRSASKIEGIVAIRGLSSLIACSMDTVTGDLYLLLTRGGIRKLVVSIFR